MTVPPLEPTPFHPAPRRRSPLRCLTDLWLT
jgi:hypothetical protein